MREDRIKQYKKYIGKPTSMTVHYLIEFSADNIIACRNPALLPALFTALKNSKIKNAITAFSTFFGLSERKNRKIIALLKNKSLLRFFENFSTTETTSRSWINFTFLINLKKGRNMTFRDKIKKFGRRYCKI